MKVLSTLQSPRGFTVVPVHYTHDAEKDQAWLIAEQNKYRRESMDWEADWAREMEMDFTSVQGALAYHYTKANIFVGLEYQSLIPLCLCVDFNVEPMVWEVAQLVGGIACFIDEIRISPASIEDMVREFRNRYPSHQAELWLYGDATGRGRHAQTGSSDYDLIRLYFRGYSAPIIFKVPAVNPPVKDRTNAFNLKMRGVEGQAGILISPKCKELIKDLNEVVMKDGQIIKTKKRDDPYFHRTHASDSAGYFIWREWPVVNEVIRTSNKKRPPRKYKRLLGILR